MFTFVPLAQAPHTLSSKSSYPSEDLYLRHHHSRHTPSRHTQPILPFVDDDSSSSSELYASRQRYYEALAEARAAEAEYLQAQARARAEEARIERQRALQAAARQRAYEEEVARRVRAREIEERLRRAKALQVERERAKKIELMRQQMFGMADIDASGHAACDPCGLCQQSQPQTPARHEEEEALRAFFEFFHGAPPAYKVCSPSHLVLTLPSDVLSDSQPLLKPNESLLLLRRRLHPPCDRLLCTRGQSSHVRPSLIPHQSLTRTHSRSLSLYFSASHWTIQRRCLRSRPLPLPLKSQPLFQHLLLRRRNPRPRRRFRRINQLKSTRSGSSQSCLVSGLLW